jgi:hypothetical protein
VDEVEAVQPQRLERGAHGARRDVGPRLRPDREGGANRVVRTVRSAVAVAVPGGGAILMGPRRFLREDIEPDLAIARALNKLPPDA